MTTALDRSYSPDAGTRYRAWPAIAPVWTSASAPARDAMLRALKAQPFEVRARLPDEAHALLEEDARETGSAPSIGSATWERAFAARARDGELADPEAFWRAAHDHPSPPSVIAP